MPATFIKCVNRKLVFIAAERWHNLCEKAPKVLPKEASGKVLEAQIVSASGPESRPELADAAKMARAVGALSSRQREVLNLIVQGRSNKEIARALKLAEGTVKIHVAALFNKLGIKRRSAAAVAGARLIAQAIKQSDSEPRPGPSASRLPGSNYASRFPGLGYTSRFSPRIPRPRSG